MAPPADGAPIFLCAQSLFKLLPRHDRLYPEIASRVGACRFWFIAHGVAALTERFRRRLGRAFAAHGLDADDYCQIVPRLGQAEFLGLNRLADVVLDSVSWSGGNTTFDAVAMDKPVVTLPGPLMRSRVSAAILGMMGIEETVAADTDDYIAIAARLATDAVWRSETIGTTGPPNVVKQKQFAVAQVNGEQDAVAGGGTNLCGTGTGLCGTGILAMLGVMMLGLRLMRYRHRSV